MIVLVESNFVIEFAQRQSEIADAERIVTLAENREGSESVFANKNSADFSGPEIETYFEQMGCKLFASFANTRQYVESVARRIGRAPPH